MRCLSCKYDLRNLTREGRGAGEHRCPECGRVFDPDDPRTFRRSRVTTTRFWLIRLGACAILAYVFVFFTINLTSDVQYTIAVPGNAPPGVTFQMLADSTIERLLRVAARSILAWPVPFVMLFAGYVVLAYASGKARAAVAYHRARPQPTVSATAADQTPSIPDS